MKLKRQPIVVVLGHVDHGKTTLLDGVRKTSVAKKESGGITQSIGASQVATKNGNKITFIDTPGHAAFSGMRERGSKAADIAILVIASDDGIMPQTKEALNFIREQKLPFIVAATKSDMPSSDEGNLKNQLAKEGVMLEEMGGDIPFISISAKENKGISELIDLIILLSDINEIKADSEGDLEGFIVETKKEKRGNAVSLIIRNGSFSVGDLLASDGIICKVRGIFDDNGKPIRKVNPGEPAVVLGFSQLPAVGASVTKGTGKATDKESIASDSRQNKISEDEMPIVLKVDSTGSKEAILQNLPKKAVVIQSGIGDLSENDVFMAKSALNCQIICFRVKVSPQVAKLAETEGVKIERFDIIYKLFERLSELLDDIEVKTEGLAEVLAIFPFNNKKIAGCKVKEGKILIGDKVSIIRNKKTIGEAKIISMRREKKEIKQSLPGEDFGAILAPQLDFMVGDMLLSHSNTEK